MDRHKPISRHKQIYLLLTVSFVFAISIVLFSSCEHRKEAEKPFSLLIDLTGDWKYRWGDSPFDINNVPEWTYTNIESSEWKTISYSNGIINPAGRNGNKILWLQVILPEKKLRNPYIYIRFVRFACEVYLEQKLLYQYKSVNEPGQGKFTEDSFSLFPIDTKFKIKSSSLEFIRKISLILVWKK